MSRVIQRAVVACLALALVGAVPKSVSAQQTNPNEADLVRRIDEIMTAIPDTRGDSEESFVRAVERRDAEWKRKNRIRDVRLDTVRVGPLTVIAPPDQIDAAAELYARSWERYASSVSDASVILDDFAFGYWAGGRFAVARTGDQLWARAQRWTSESRQELRTAGAITTALGRKMPPEVLGWSAAMPLLGDRSVLGLAPAQPTLYGRAYSALATVSSRSVVRCFDGDVASCVMALGLDNQASWQDLYSMGEIRALVALAGRGDSRRELDERVSCLTLSDDEACVAAVADARPRALVPLPTQARYSLLHFALEAGGGGAFTRLIEGDEVSISERLEHASGMGLHDLVAGWRTRTLESRPQVTAGLPFSVVVSLFWVGVMFLFSLRSTRWRTG